MDWRRTLSTRSAIKWLSGLFLAERSNPRVIYGDDPDARVFDGYAVKDDGLYLLYERSWGGLLIRRHQIQTSIVGTEDIIRFRKQHPELEKHWPEPTAEDGGWAWNMEGRTIKPRLEMDPVPPDTGKENLPKDRRQSDIDN